MPVQASAARVGVELVGDLHPGKVRNNYGRAALGLGFLREAGRRELSHTSGDVLSPNVRQDAVYLIRNRLARGGM